MNKMGTISERIKKAIFEATKVILPDLGLKVEDIALEHPVVEEHGDFSTNIALKLAQQTGQNPTELADKIIASLARRRLACVESTKVAGPGFINLFLDSKKLRSEVGKIIGEGEKFGSREVLKAKKIMVEFAHPNTHKELHIGHMRTLITGEALARIFTASGAKVFRANYQGDIGPHVAKAIWGTERLLKERKTTWEKAEKLSLKEKAHLLGQGYIKGNQGHEENKEEIDGINGKLYTKDPSIWPIYERTRKWSLDYYDEFYKRFYTKFDQLYFESDVAGPGKKIVMDNIGKIFEKSDKAVIFDGEKYGLHKRVFITGDGNPTYEGKEMALGQRQIADFPFDLCVHVVASEQAGYFQVVIKALELLDEKFKGKEFHLSMGMVQLVGRKISSRTGEIITVDGLLDDVKDLLRPMVSERGYTELEKETILEASTVAAVKYSVLKTSPLMNATFDIAKSVSLEGDSGPYLQYTYARAKSVLRKAMVDDRKLKIVVEGGKSKIDHQKNPSSNLNLQPLPSIFDHLSSEELGILRYLYRFPEVVEAAARQYSPNLICTYLFELAKRYNNLYNNCPILGNDFRLQLTSATAQVIKNGLNLLGIATLERM